MLDHEPLARVECRRVDELRKELFMKVKSRKVSDLEQLQEDLAASPTMFICAFEGLKVAEDFELRKQVRAAGANYRVVQNRMARLASKGTAY